MTKKKKGDIFWCIACRIDLRRQNVKKHLAKGHKVKVVEKDPRDTRPTPENGTETAKRLAW